MKNDHLVPKEGILPFDPALQSPDTGVVFIGRIHTPWQNRSECPRNVRIARERGQPAHIEIDELFRPGLRGLEGISHIHVLYWLHEAQRNMVMRASDHSPGPTGIFALRSPVRPNPIGLAVVKVTKLDIAAGRIDIDGIDCIDGTNLLDIKPYLPSVDAYGTADPGWQGKPVK